MLLHIDFASFFSIKKDIYLNLKEKQIQDKENLKLKPGINKSHPLVCEFVDTSQTDRSQDKN